MSSGLVPYRQNALELYKPVPKTSARRLVWRYLTGIKDEKKTKLRIASNAEEKPRDSDAELQRILLG